MATSSTRDRKPHYLEIRTGRAVQLNLVASAYSAGLQTALGLSETEPTGGASGIGKEDAMNQGAVPVVLYYQVSRGGRQVLQAARVLCSPAKADTIFTEAIGKQYAGKAIKKVRFPRRRRYTF